MPAVYGKVVWVKPGEVWGFANIENTRMNVLVHPRQKCKVLRTGFRPHDFSLKQEAPCVLKTGDELVLEAVQNPEGKGRAIAWTFRSEWDAVCTKASAPGPTVVPLESAGSSVASPEPTPTSASKPVFVPPAPKADPALTFGEMLEALDFRFLHALLDPMEKKELTLPQLQDFVRNTPKGKRGEALWDEFHRRKAKSRDKKYGIATFIKEVLVDAGFIVEV